jgi:NitT/TauT family transport system ATP-binding protein
MSEILLRLKQLTKTFHQREVLRDLNFEMPAGQFLCLLGPSGCGKSTLLRLLAGLESPTSGQIQWRGSPKFSFVFQDSELLPWRNALENVRLPLELQSTYSRAELNARALQSLNRVGLADAAPVFPHELSGGMKMRVSVARALCRGPEVIFMDEPFSALDEIARFEMQKQIRQLCDEEKLSVVFVTHSSAEAATLGDRILLLSGDGVLISDELAPTNATRDEWTHKVRERMRGAPS